MQEMYETAVKDIANPALKTASPMMRFAHMEDLGREMKVFRRSCSTLADEKKQWIRFI
jgi:hypothetical protein